MPKFYIHEQRLEWFKAQFARLTRKANKIGVSAPTYTLGVAEERAETHREEIGENPLTGRAEYQEYTVITRYYPVEVMGEAPKFAGWTFAATLQDLEGQVLVRSIVETPAPERFRNSATVGDCNHCNTARNRKDTFLLVSDAGEWKQVGRQCLKDFLGHAAPEKLARMAEFLMEARAIGEGGGMGGVSERFPLDQYMAVVAAVMDKKGWLSRTKARDEGKQATADIALRHYAPSAQDMRDFRNGRETRISASEFHVKRATEALAWAEDLSDDDCSNDYMSNIRAIATAKVVDFRTAGYAASIIIAHDKALERVRARMARPESNHVGTVGARMVLTLTIKKIVTCDTQFGVSYLHIMTDEMGNDIKWFGSKMLVNNEGEFYREGSTVTVKATIKKHDVYEGRKQTMINRPTVQKGDK